LSTIMSIADCLPSSFSAIGLPCRYRQGRLAGPDRTGKSWLLTLVAFGVEVLTALRRQLDRFISLRQVRRSRSPWRESAPSCRRVARHGSIRQEHCAPIESLRRCEMVLPCQLLPMSHDQTLIQGNGTLRRECRSHHWFGSLLEVQTTPGTCPEWTTNNHRSHTSLGLQPRRRCFDRGGGIPALFATLKY
jgi:hypothetical protein